MAKRPPLRSKKAAARLAVPTVMPDDDRGARRVRAALDNLDGVNQAGVDRLDTSRPYGRVTGDFVVRGVRVAYEQKARGGGSRLFDHEGNRIYREGEKRVAPPAPKRQGGPMKPVAEAAQPQTAAEAGKEEDDEEEEMPPMTLPASVPEGDDDDVNLLAWGERQVTYRWAAVRDAIEARYGRVVNDENEARDFLQEEGIGQGSGRAAGAHGG